MPEAQPTKRRHSRLAWGCLAALIIVALFLLALAVTAGRTHRALERKRDQLRAAGILKDLADLVPRVPPGERNAADIYQQALDAHATPGAGVDDLDAVGASPTDLFSSWTDHQQAAARRIVSANARALALAAQASRTPACAFPVDWTEPYAAVFPHLSRLRDLTRVLPLQAKVLAADGSPDLALAVCGVMLRVADHTKAEPTLTSQLVAYVIQGGAVAAIEDVLATTDPSPQACRALYAQLAAVDQLSPSVRAAQGELASGSLLFSRFRDGSIADPGSPHPSGWQLGPSGWEPPNAGAWPIYQSLGGPLLDLDELTYLGLMEMHIEALTSPPPQSSRRARDADAAFSDIPSYRALITDLIKPTVATSVASRDTKQALIGAAQIALALRIYRSERGRYPDSLADLERAGWKLPRDPFTDPPQPYRYRRDGPGFILWSLGPDATDQGGSSPTPGPAATPPPWDLPFRSPR